MVCFLCCTYGTYVKRHYHGLSLSGGGGGALQSRGIIMVIRWLVQSSLRELDGLNGIHFQRVQCRAFPIEMVSFLENF